MSFPPLADGHHQTCKELRKTLESRYVWKHVLRNIFSAFQLPSLRNALLQLSADELKKKAIVATRLAHMWGQETVIPQKVRKFKCDCDVTSFRLLPGGKWMVVAQCGGSLELHDMRSEPPTLWIVDRTLCDDIDFFFVDLLLSVSQSGQILAILETCSGKHSHRDGVYVCPSLVYGLCLSSLADSLKSPFFELTSSPSPPCG